MPATLKRRDQLSPEVEGFDLLEFEFAILEDDVAKREQRAREEALAVEMCAYYLDMKARRRLYEEHYGAEMAAWYTGPYAEARAVIARTNARANRIEGR